MTSVCAASELAALLLSGTSIENTVANTPESNITQAEETPFAQPPSGTADVELDKPVTQAERDAVRRGEITNSDGTVIGNIE